MSSEYQPQANTGESNSSTSKRLFEFDEGGWHYTTPDDSPQLIQITINWMYQNEISIPESMVPDRRCDRYDKNSGPGLLVKLYVIGQKYQMPTLRNDVLDATSIWMNNMDYGMTVEALAYAWENTAEGSPLRTPLLNIVKDYFNSDVLEELREHLKAEFWSDLAID